MLDIAIAESAHTGFAPFWCKCKKKFQGYEGVSWQVAAPGIDNKPQPTNQCHSIIAHHIRIVQITAGSMELYFLLLLLTKAIEEIVGVCAVSWRMGVASADRNLLPYW